MAREHASEDTKAASRSVERRREERRECSQVARLTTANAEYPCVVSDVAPHGLRFAATASAELQIGEKVTITGDSFGSTTGVIRWTAHPRYGFEIADGVEAPAPLMQFYDSLSAHRTLETRLKFLEMDERTSELLRAARPLLAVEVPKSLDGLYRRIRAMPSLKAFFSGEAHVASARNAQTRHWDEVASGVFDERYLQRVRRIGLTHARIGLEPRWYMGGYAHVLSDLANAIIIKRWPKSRWGSRATKDAAETGAMIGAIIKAVFLEMDIAISTYLQSNEEERLRGEDAAITLERATVAKSIGEGLAKLAEKDLTYRMHETLPSAYKKLQENFNLAAQYLETALTMVVRTSEGVRSGMQEISSASDDLSHRTEQQAASIEQTVAALNEIKEGARKTAEGAQQAHMEMKAAQSDAQHSGNVARGAVTTMNKIAESSREISQIIGVVDEIAFQTNLLALNAGVEAARAGEVGRGFAVVASEVRALAQRSSQAAKEIRALIEASSVHVNDGVAQVAEAGASLERISEKVTTINSGIAEIAHTAQDQANGLREVTVAVAEMDVLTQQNAAMAEQATAAAQSLQRETGQLFALIGEFLVSQSKDTAPVVVKPRAGRTKGAAIEGRRAGGRG